MRAYRIRENAGSLILTVSLILSASAYGQTAIIAAKDCPNAAVASPSDCGLPSRSDLTVPSNSRRTSSPRDGETEPPTQSMNDTALSYNIPEPCATQAICPPPSASVNRLDSDLPSPTPLKTKTHRDVYSRPSTANNSFKSDQTKDERGRTVMGH